MTLVAYVVLFPSPSCTYLATILAFSMLNTHMLSLTIIHSLHCFNEDTVHSVMTKEYYLTIY